MTKCTSSAHPRSRMLIIYVDIKLLTSLPSGSLRQDLCLKAQGFAQETVRPNTTNLVEIVTRGQQHNIESWGEWQTVIGWVSMRSQQEHKIRLRRSCRYVIKTKVWGGVNCVIVLQIKALAYVDSILILRSAQQLYKQVMFPCQSSNLRCLAHRQKYDGLS